MIILVILVLLFLLYAFFPSYNNKQRFFRKEKTKRNVIYLTFDDGPSEHTEELLKLLKKYNIKATFFCVANFAKERPDIRSEERRVGKECGS